MTDLLRSLSDFSTRRVADARSRCPEPELRRRARDAPPPVRLRFHPSGFDLIAEVKLRSPSAGRLVDPGADPHRVARDRSAAYAAGGAAAISVLTEPSAFDGSLSHLAAASGAMALPVLRKDFLVDPYQVLEARAAGASGVLLIVRLLKGDLLRRMLDAAGGLGMFSLLEVFDLEEADRIGALLESGRPASDAPILLGVNARDLRSLAVHGDSLEKLATRLPAGPPTVAESGLTHEADVARAASVGYSLALVGTALMRSHRPRLLTSALLQAGRRAKPRRAAGGD
jgi:indole-3-glycerol phosphate synthase